MRAAKSKPLPSPPTPTGTTAAVVSAGPPIPAIERLRLFSDTQWEEFVLEWADSLRSDYERVERCGGPGDLGRDVIAICRDGGGAWDNYQCKHYKGPLAPSDVWCELGKLVYYTKLGTYTLPRRYLFVAPQGVGTKLSNLLRNADRLRTELLDNWDGYCKNGITGTAEVPLDADLNDYILSLDFSIFDSVPPLRIIEQHAKTRWHAARFGGGLPQRPPVTAPPPNPAPTEARYLRQLLDAYGDHLKQHFGSPADLPEGGSIREHFIDAREQFYSAESLRAFSRDTLPPGEFERLQDEFHHGVADEARFDHPDGYRRVTAVVKAALSLQITSHPLVSCLGVRDRGGICHQLANEDRVRWVR